MAAACREYQAVVDNDPNDTQTWLLLAESISSSLCVHDDGALCTRRPSLPIGANSASPAAAWAVAPAGTPMGPPDASPLPPVAAHCGRPPAETAERLQAWLDEARTADRELGGASVEGAQR